MSTFDTCTCSRVASTLPIRIVFPHVRRSRPVCLCVKSIRSDQKRRRQTVPRLLCGRALLLQMQASLRQVTANSGATQACRGCLLGINSAPCSYEPCRLSLPSLNSAFDSMIWYLLASSRHVPLTRSTRPPVRAAVVAGGWPRGHRTPTPTRGVKPPAGAATQPAPRYTFRVASRHQKLSAAPNVDERGQR
jgi:hypothetical protein